MKKGYLLIAGLLVLFGAKAQQVDVQHYDFSLALNDTTNRIEGNAIVTVRYLEDATTIHLDLAGSMKVAGVYEGKEVLSFTQDSASLYINTHSKAGDTKKYAIVYAGIPANGLIISRNKFGHRTFFTDHWPDRAHQWIPCIDHPADKATVTFTVIAPDHYTVVANGRKQLEEQLPDHLKRTVYKETVPLPVKVMALGVADFAVNHAGDVAGIPVYSYVFPENKNKGFLDYAKAVQILPYFIKQIGPYPFEKLANVQSKTIFGGMENAGAIFYFEGSVGHKGIESLLAHEIAHQWFGDAVTEIDWRHLWLSEGFATYMTHLYLEQKYGADTLKAGMRTDRIKVLEFAKSRQTPVVDTAVHHNFMQLLNANSYEKGGWVLHMLRRQLGDSLFWKGIRQYFKDYNGRNASTDDFRNEMEKVSGQDLKGFFDEWLFNAATPDLYVHWKYDAETKAVQLEVRQEQGSLMTFPLEYTIGHEKQVKKVMIREKVTTFSVPVAARPDTITIDPRVNLLATVRVKGE